MKAIYLKNLKKLKAGLEIKTASMGVADITAYPFNDRLYPHDHTSYSFGPWNNSYSSPLFHINLFQVVDPKQLKNLNCLLVRDGLFTLVDFFHRFPNPKEFKPLFLVHENHKSFVPEAWVKKVLFYSFEVYSNFYDGKSYNDNLIVKGSIMHGTYDSKKVFSLIESVVEQKKKKKVLLSIAPRQNNFLDQEWTGDADFGKLANTFIKDVHNILAKKVEVEFINWKEFFAMQDIHKFEFLDFNIKSQMYMDDYSDFFLFKRGAKPAILKPRKAKNEADLLIGLTNSHGVRIFSSPEFSKINHCEKLDKIFANLELKKKEKLTVAGFHAINDLAKLTPENYEDKYFI